MFFCIFHSGIKHEKTIFFNIFFLSLVLSRNQTWPKFFFPSKILIRDMSILGQRSM